MLQPPLPVRGETAVTQAKEYTNETYTNEVNLSSSLEYENKGVL